MQAKALNNIEAAKLLTANGLFDSAASRAYYGVYLMAWHTMDRRGEQPYRKAKDGGYYWPHDCFAVKLFKDGRISELQRDEWEWLYSQRIRADYYREGIEEAMAEKASALAAAFIEYFLDEEA